jgi:Zn-dependent M16 (insulinase) family peptidase
METAIAMQPTKFSICVSFCSGHAAINTRMKARYRVSGYVDEMAGGISQLEALRDLIKQAEEDWPSLQARLENMRNVILDSNTCRNGMFLDVTGDAAVLAGVGATVAKFLSDLPGDSNGAKLPNFYKEEHPWVAPIKERMAEVLKVEDEGFVVPTQVSYVGKAGLVYDQDEKIDGSAQVISKFLSTGVSSDCKKWCATPGNGLTKIAF